MGYMYERVVYYLKEEMCWIVVVPELPGCQADGETMDEALAFVTLDISGRGYLVYEGGEMSERIGEYETELTEEFLRAMANNAGLTLHVKVIYGKNSHHKTEAIFKALGHAMRIAVERDQRMKEIPSTKGVI